MRVAFGSFTLDSGTRELLRDAQPVHLSPKAFDLLQILVERRPEVVAKPEIQERVWPRTFVEDASLSVLVAELRRALDDDPKRPEFIRTVHGRGYAFCGTARPAAPPGVSSPAEGTSKCWITWRDQSRPLAPGSNVIGRDPECEIWLDARGVSRRHARITVSGTTAIVEDLSSTNGTFVGRKKVTAPLALADGDVITLGAETVTFRAWAEGGTAATERVRKKRS
jgi:DNA-binding winged helix-turn-helix (wHTH) protein